MNMLMMRVIHWFMGFLFVLNHIVSISAVEVGGKRMMPCPFAKSNGCPIYDPRVTEEDRDLNYKVDGASDRENLIQQGFSDVISTVEEGENVQLQFEEAQRTYQNKNCGDANHMSSFIDEISPEKVLSPELIAQCEKLIEDSYCDPSYAYRTFNGACNHLNHPSWGMGGSCFIRLVKSYYSDGISSPRLSVSGCPLPLASETSEKLHKGQGSRYESRVNHMFVMFGQFLAHDVSLSLSSPSGRTEARHCCPPTQGDPQACEPILVKPENPLFQNYNVYCLDFIRTAVCPTCRFEPRQQPNQQSAFIDLSHVYGHHLNISSILRSLDGSGTLRSSFTEEGDELLPPSHNPDDDSCSFQMKGHDCFGSGDERTNQHTALTSMHTIYMRQHNRLARKLLELNPNWSEETVFQTARHILEAQNQVIVYKEYLPLLLGQGKVEEHSLTVKTYGYTEYDSSVNPGISNEFSAAAFRFGHAMVSTYFPNVDANNNTMLQTLRDSFFQPFGLYYGQLEYIIRGLYMYPAQQFSRFMVDDTTYYMYKLPSEKIGTDLAAMSYQRTIDHGIAPYVEIVRYCGGSNIHTFDDLREFVNDDCIPILQNVFKSVKDIDFFSGGMCEKPHGKSLVGYTFTCVIAEQFHRTKYGDRFYFEHGQQVGSFSPNQLTELRKTTLAKIICENSKIQQLPKSLMTFSNHRNPVLNCSSIPDIDLTAWKVS